MRGRLCFPGGIVVAMDRRRFLYSAITPLAFRLYASAGGKRPELPFRHVHLDFHNSELVPDVGADWDPEAFAATLKSARVNSINAFAKCHHGYAYYETEIGTKHPSLKADL